MIVHRGWDNDPVTCSDIVRDQYVKAPVHALHRLDRGTSGVLLFALDKEAASFVQAEAVLGNVKKQYLALVRGPMKQGCVLDHRVPKRDGSGRVDALTEFIPLAHKDRWSLVRACPRTGRLHQIRRHLKHLSHPIVGDVRYGKGDINRLFREQYGLKRLALHSSCLEFVHPDGGLRQIKADLPEDFSDPLIRLGLLLPEIF